MAKSIKVEMYILPSDDGGEREPTRSMATQEKGSVIMGTGFDGAGSSTGTGYRTGG